jgi:hypothetical protein
VFVNVDWASCSQVVSVDFAFICLKVVYLLIISAD